MMMIAQFITENKNLFFIVQVNRNSQMIEREFGVNSFINMHSHAELHQKEKKKTIRNTKNIRSYRQMKTKKLKQ